jgi:hypothetical protein
MPRKPPVCRIGYFAGMRDDGTLGANGTWIEGEFLCYPSGGMLRRAYAVCQDGVKRVVQCGLADTYTAIPARVKIQGRWRRGYVSINNGTITFTPYDGEFSSDGK